MKKNIPAKRRIPKQALVWLCVAALLVTLLPLYAISFYNHACYDDFGFSIRTHRAWEDTGSLVSTLRAALENTVAIRQTWEGTYATSFLSALQPALGGEGLYWLTTAVLLTFFLLSLGFFLRQTIVRLLGADRQTFLLAFCSLSFVMIQFVPDLSEAFFWFNGGVAYTLMWSVMVLRLGVWVCFARARGARRALSALALVLLTAVMGGAKYSTVLFAVLADALIVAYGFWKRRADRWARLAVFMLLLAGFVFSMAAPGNGVRARTLLGGMSAPRAVLQAFYFGIALMGHWFSLPLLVVWALVAWQFSEALRGCPQRFHHPVWITVLCVCLFCAQLAPTLYTGNYLGDGRAVNTYFYTFVLMSCALTMYWTGWWIRRTEGQSSPFPAIGTAKSDGLRVAAFAAALLLLVTGCLSFRPEGSQTYGLSNTAAGSALRSLLKGEAAAYDAAMDERDAALNDPDAQEVTLRPVENVPRAFMGDALTGDNLEYVLSLYQTYYDKQRVSIAEEE